jgi:plasmid stabilization system protein ParE
LNAAVDLERISDYIAEDNPEAARRVALHIVRIVGGLDMFPNRGRPGRVNGTRESVLAPLPFLAIYEVDDEEVQVLRLRWRPGC